MEQIWTLITRVLSGEASENEKKELDNWLKESDENRELFHRLESSWTEESNGYLDATLLFSHERGVKRLRNKMVEEGASNHVIGSRKSSVSRVRVWAIAASILFAAIGISAYMTLQYWEVPQSMVYETSEVEQRIITLSDGSIVRLNRESTLEVPHNYMEGTRDVTLKGEAFFDVQSNEELPFRIKTDQAVVEVLGTSFNIKEGTDLMVAVKEGMVSLRHIDREESEATRLAAGQLGLLNVNEREIRVEEPNLENYISWINGYLRFENTPFDEVLTQLERFYDLEFDVQDPEIRNLHLTAYTERINQVDEVLETIAMAVGLDYSKVNGTVNWKLN
jgi:transmembrane sensor